MTALQGVTILDIEERSEPKPHSVYKIQVKAGVRSWLVWRRYSEFDDLDEELTRATNEAPPTQLPPKHVLSIFRSHSDPKLLEERKAGLEAYLRAIVSSKDPRWRDCYAFQQFLSIPSTKPGISHTSTNPGDFTAATWLDEHAAVHDGIRDIRADISKRDALLDRSDGPAAHRANLDAKKKLAALIPRTVNLTKGLQQLGLGGLSEGELQRRTDMVLRIKNDCEGLTTMVHAAKFAARGIAGPTSVATRREASEADRQELLAGSPTSSKPFRIFGRSSEPQETEETRRLDNQGLLQLQRQEMSQQDSQLSDLTTILQRQKQLGVAIYNEIEQQNETIDDLTRATDKQMRRLG
ncbi:Phox homologous domain-containing protein [Flagelloscypha sp. PMI_526]|nr:Phox homologous domain-containing protein [Flagelloscypha sp. PMI_526]